MANITWGEAKEIVDICLELDQSGMEIVNQIRNRAGLGLIEGLNVVMALLAISDHPSAQSRYESMREHITRLNRADTWERARSKLKASIRLEAYL